MGDGAAKWRARGEGEGQIGRRGTGRIGMWRRGRRRRRSSGTRRGRRGRGEISVSTERVDLNLGGNSPPTTLAHLCGLCTPRTRRTRRTPCTGRSATSRCWGAASGRSRRCRPQCRRRRRTDRRRAQARLRSARRMPIERPPSQSRTTRPQRGSRSTLRSHGYPPSSLGARRARSRVIRMQPRGLRGRIVVVEINIKYMRGGKSNR